NVGIRHDAPRSTTLDVTYRRRPPGGPVDRDDATALPRLTPLTGCGAAWLARRSGGPKVPGSSPGSPTTRTAGPEPARRVCGPSPHRVRRLVTEWSPEDSGIAAGRDAAPTPGMG